MHVAEQLALLGRREDGAAAELARAPDVVHERGGDQQIGAEPRMELRRLAAERRDADGVLEQPARVGMVAVGRRRQYERGGACVAAPCSPRARSAALLISATRNSRKPCSSSASRRIAGAIVAGSTSAAGSSVRTSSCSLSRNFSTRPEHPHRVALAEARVEQLDVVPDARVDAAARVDELEREVRARRPSSAAAPCRDGVHALDRRGSPPVGDRRHAAESRPSVAGQAVADVRPFRALRYDEGRRPARRPRRAAVRRHLDERAAELQARSPHNVVHLTLPDSEEQAARDLAAWREAGVLVEDEEPSYWWLAQDYVGPDGVARTRDGFVAALRAEPY